MYHTILAKNQDKKQKFNSTSTVNPILKKSGYSNIPRQRTKNISEFDMNDVRMYYNDMYSRDIIQMNRNDFFLCCWDMGLPTGRQGPIGPQGAMTDQGIYRILSMNQNNVGKFDELVKQLIRNVPDGDSGDMSFDTVNGVFNIIRAHFPEIDVKALWERLSEPQIVQGVMESDDEELTPFHSETDEEMQMVFTVHSEKNIVNARRSDCFHRHFSVDFLCDTELSCDILIDHACCIHRAAGGRSELTIVCAQYRTDDGKYLKVCFSNSPLPSATARDAAQSLFYIPGHGIGSHAELNMILYSDKHMSNLQFVTHGCNRATCPQCAALLRFRFGDEVNLGQVRQEGRFSRNYRTSGSENISPARFNDYRSIIEEHYDSDGRLHK